VTVALSAAVWPSNRQRVRRQASPADWPTTLTGGANFHGSLSVLTDRPWRNTANGIARVRPLAM
jgi:hypothetical protein